MQKELDFSFPHNEIDKIFTELKEASKHQLFFGGSEEKQVMEDLNMEVEEWELNTGGMDWSKGNKDRVEFVHTSLSKGLLQELREMDTAELLRIENELKFKA